MVEWKPTHLGRRRKIALGKDLFAIVNGVDYPRVSEKKWRPLRGNDKFYAVTNKWDGKKNTHIFLHKVVLETQKPVDHIDLNPLNNLRHNLRECTVTENNWNRTKYSVNGAIPSSPYKGVFLSAGRWRATIAHNRKRLSLGSFDTPEEAARAWNAKCLELRGEFARLNDVTDVSPEWWK